MRSPLSPDARRRLTPGLTARRGRWSPLVWIGPCFLVRALAMAAVVLVGAAVLWPIGWGRSLLLVGPAVFRIFCSLRGLEVDLQDESQIVYLHFR